jgi:hypothetical protein
MFVSRNSVGLPPENRVSVRFLVTGDKAPQITLAACTRGRLILRPPPSALRPPPSALRSPPSALRPPPCVITRVSRELAAGVTASSSRVLRNSRRVPAQRIVPSQCSSRCRTSDLLLPLFAARSFVAMLGGPDGACCRSVGAHRKPYIFNVPYDRRNASGRRGFPFEPTAYPPVDLWQRVFTTIFVCA